MSNALPPTFPGFPDFRANVTFVPIQFFTVVLPYCARGTVRIVGYALRKVLGWVDEHGNPTREQLRFTYRELIEQAGVSREAITEALREALERRLLRCLEIPQPDSAGQAGRSGVYELCWDREGAYTDDPVAFRGFYSHPGSLPQGNCSPGPIPAVRFGAWPPPPAPRPCRATSAASWSRRNGNPTRPTSPPPPRSW
jgi:hypothetical protein